MIPRNAAIRWGWRRVFACRAGSRWGGRGRWLAVLLLVVASGVKAEPIPGLKARSWAGAALPGGALVRVRIDAGGKTQLVEHICGAAVAGVPPSGLDGVLPGSELLALILPDGAEGRLFVPDLAWSRWALELSAPYHAVVCARLHGALDDAALRAAWLDLLRHIDQRAREEAARLAADMPHWAQSLREAELVAMVEALSLFPVPSDEQERWLEFLLLVPPGPLQLALLRAAEGSSRPFFATFVARFGERWRDDAAFRAQCAALSLAQRPEACPSLPENVDALRKLRQGQPQSLTQPGGNYADP